VFPVVWTTLYILMALSAMRVAGSELNGQAMAFWALQIALNTLWTPVFFGLHRIRAGMVVISLLWLAVALTTWSFFTVDLWAGIMIFPYLVWVSIASALNFSVMRLNPEVRDETAA
jgi:tryptophan-rich sensory protein